GRALARVVAIGAEREEAPEVEALELLPGTRLDVAREQALARVAVRGDRLERGDDPGQRPEELPLGHVSQLTPEVLEVACEDGLAARGEGARRQAARAEDLVADPGVGAPVHAHALGRARPAVKLEEGALDRPPPGAGR